MKKVSIKEYDKEIDKIIKKGKPIGETLIDMLDYANTVRIKNININDIVN